MVPAELLVEFARLCAGDGCGVFSFVARSGGTTALPSSDMVGVTTDGTSDSFPASIDGTNDIHVERPRVGSPSEGVFSSSSGTTVCTESLLANLVNDVGSTIARSASGRD